VTPAMHAPLCWLMTTWRRRWRFIGSIVNIVAAIILGAGTDAGREDPAYGTVECRMGLEIRETMVVATAWGGE